MSRYTNPTKIQNYENLNQKTHRLKYKTQNQNKNTQIQNNIINPNPQEL